MNLDHIATPETDAAKRKIEGFADEWVPRYVSEEMERRIAVCREALQYVHDNHHEGEGLLDHIVTEALENTAPLA